MPPSFPVTDPKLADTATALAQWRSTRPRSSRIPDELWSQATELAERYGIAKVAAALKLDYKNLKRRLTARKTGEDAPSAPMPPSFVELDLGLPLAPPACVLILTDRAGRALRIELPQAASSHLAEVARSLWQMPLCSR